MPEPTSKPFIEITLPQAQPLVLLSPEEAARWANEELANWNWIVTARNIQESYLDQWISQLRQLLNQLQQACSELQKQPQAEQIQNHFRNAVTQLYATGHLPLSKSPVGEFVCTYARQFNATRAAGALVAMRPHDKSRTHSSTVDAVAGIADAIMFQHGVIDNQPSCAKAVADALADWASQLGEFSKTHDQTLTALATKFEQELGEHGESVRRWKETTEHDRDAALKSFAAVKQLYHEHMALAAPARYWENKKKSHRWQAWLWGISFFVFLLVGAGGTLYLSLWLLGLHERLPASMSAGPATQYTFWERLATVGLFLTFTAWLLRVLCRVWLSNLHMSADASERVTMIHTYLALLKRKCATEDSHRTLVLNAIFRPGSTGLVKSEPISHVMLSPMALGTSGKSDLG